ncbi:hypothetical protein JZ751_021374 [Albula glossodonta]|uniref:Uncharacterized protein n=1 Tax=Albula glossodonta TaxID=121402 RepID=A0A8T2NSF0_9TELE|nr:hypothetical protein JZ751_021374 [Albula glossodonta]
MMGINAVPLLTDISPLLGPALMARTKPSHLACFTRLNDTRRQAPRSAATLIRPSPPLPFPSTPGVCICAGEVHSLRTLFYLDRDISTIEACLGHMLKRRAAGFLRSDKIAALFTKMGKVNSTVAEVCRKVQEQLQQQAEATRAVLTVVLLMKYVSAVPPTVIWTLTDSSASGAQEQMSAPGLSRRRHGHSRVSDMLDPVSCLNPENADPTTGAVEEAGFECWARPTASIHTGHKAHLGANRPLREVGPCALEYTKLKTSDHFWTDPSANELVQRHRIHGAHRGQDPSPSRRPALGIRKRQSSGSMAEDRFAASAREYVWLTKCVCGAFRWQPSLMDVGGAVDTKKDMEVLRGYLSLHQAGENLTLKWTPNQLINGTLGDCHLENSGLGWYPGTGGHLLAFLSCLETGLLPRGQLEPPLWSQRGKVRPRPLRLATHSRQGKQ